MRYRNPWRFVSFFRIKFILEIFNINFLEEKFKTQQRYRQQIDMSMMAV